MSEENVEIVRAMLDAFNRGDFDASLEFLAEDIEWHDPADVPGAGVHRGPDEVRRFFVAWLGAWETYTAEAEELIDAGDRVVVVHHEWGRGRESGIEVDNRSANLFELRDGKVVRRWPFPDRESALQAAGLAN
ncbi:MAG TPA: nuclear transport factor 2 family protein [Solirubrobacterales bacterium]|nr:nuclear transport factor 2 family protein [Solirubrobacterales bacterium]